MGAGLPAVAGGFAEPALIDPALPVDWASPDWFGTKVGYWPSYAELTPQARAAYLRWLERGRIHRDVSVGYAFLFLYGLERRVLVDLAGDAELALIRAEVERLDGLFGAHASFRGYATEFCRFLDDLAMVDASEGPPPDSPAALRVGLGKFARDGRRLRPEWALAWVMAHPSYHPRTPAKRCPEEFARLFALRFHDRHPDGFRIRPSGDDLAFSYRPASGGFAGMVTKTVPGVPDVFDQPLALRRLASLAEECAEALDTFSRWVGREAARRDSLAGAALLPDDLVDLESGEPGRLVEWARSRLGAFAMTSVPTADLLRWVDDDQPAKKEILALARLLGRAKIGLEPDPRFGGPVADDGSVVLFQIGDEPDATPTQAYQAASLLLRLGAAVSTADGNVAPEEKQLLIGHLEQELHLTRGERARLRAHLRWLLTTEVKLTGLAKSIAAVDHEQREHLAAFLAAIAAADGRIDPAEVRTLRRITKLLGLTSESMDGYLRAATEPVVVRPASPVPGRVIPPPERAEGPKVQLDQTLLAARIQEAAEVASLLTSVFGDDQQPPPPLPAVEPVAGLDAAHSRLLRSLTAHTVLPRSAWDDMAAAGRVLPEGAIDRLNEAAYDATGEPVIEGEDPLEINHDALGALL